MNNENRQKNYWRPFLHIDEILDAHRNDIDFCENFVYEYCRFCERIGTADYLNRAEWYMRKLSEIKRGKKNE